MSSANGPFGPDQEQVATPPNWRQTLECQLFESLVHHLIEKGLFTRNDALGVVQTVAEVKHGELEGGRIRDAFADHELTVLKRLYSSFELVPDLPITSQALGAGNVVELRPPLHGNHPAFPEEE